MHVSTYVPLYKRLGDGTVAYIGREGSGFFTRIDELLFMQVMDDHASRDAVIDLPDGRYRLLGKRVSTNSVGNSDWMAMKDGLLARLLAKWYGFLGRYGYRIVRWERKYGGLWHLRDGDTLPWWSLSGLLSRTYLEPQ